MSTHTVIRAFKTPTRRFAVGQSVTEQDVAGPVPFGDWVAKGFIQPPVAPEPAAEPTILTVAGDDHGFDPGADDGPAPHDDGTEPAD